MPDPLLPDFDFWQIANLMDYAQIHAVRTNPEWRAKRQKKFGICGTRIPGYTDTSKVYLWTWDEEKLGRLEFDSGIVPKCPGGID